MPKDGRKSVVRIKGKTKFEDMGRGRFLLKDRRLSGFKSSADHFDTYDDAKAFVEKCKTHPVIGPYALDVVEMDNSKHNPISASKGKWEGSKIDFSQAG